MLHIHIHHMLKALVIYFQLEKKKEFLLKLIRKKSEVKKVTWIRLVC